MASRPRRSVVSDLVLLLAFVGVSALNDGCECAAGEPMSPDASDGNVSDASDSSVPNDASDGSLDASDGGDAGDAAAPCGDGYLGEFEVCDPSIPAGSDPQLRCLCETDDPCMTSSCKEGTSPDMCNCECELRQRTGYGITNCDDDDACTTDSFGEGSSPETCSLVCVHTPVPFCQCGNGVFQPEEGETCEDGTEEPCTCDDGDPCTDDVGTASAGSCTKECTHPPRVGFGKTTCDDGLACTTDVITGGSPATCNVTCDNQVTPNWAINNCNDMNSCTADSVAMFTPSTCGLVCNNTTLTGYGTRTGTACTSGGGCTGTSCACSGTGYTTCNDADPCTADTITSGSAATCNLGCSHRSTRYDDNLPHDCSSASSRTITIAPGVQMDLAGQLDSAGDDYFLVSFSGSVGNPGQSYHPRIQLIDWASNGFRMQVVGSCGQQAACNQAIYDWEQNFLYNPSGAGGGCIANGNCSDTITRDTTWVVRVYNPSGVVPACVGYTVRMSNFN